MQHDVQQGRGQPPSLQAPSSASHRSGGVASRAVTDAPIGTETAPPSRRIATGRPEVTRELWDHLTSILDNLAGLPMDDAIAELSDRLTELQRRGPDAIDSRFSDGVVSHLAASFATIEGWLVPSNRERLKSALPEWRGRIRIMKRLLAGWNNRVSPPAPESMSRARAVAAANGWGEDDPASEARVEELAGSSAALLVAESFPDARGASLVIQLGAHRLRGLGIDEGTRGKRLRLARVLRELLSGVGVAKVAEILESPAMDPSGLLRDLAASEAALDADSRLRCLPRILDPATLVTELGANTARTVAQAVAADPRGATSMFALRQWDRADIVKELQGRTLAQVAEMLASAAQKEAVARATLAAHSAWWHGAIAREEIDGWIARLAPEPSLADQVLEQPALLAGDQGRPGGAGDLRRLSPAERQVLAGVSQRVAREAVVAAAALAEKARRLGLAAGDLDACRRLLRTCPITINFEAARALPGTSVETVVDGMLQCGRYRSSFETKAGHADRRLLEEERVKLQVDVPLELHEHVKYAGLNTGNLAQGALSAYGSCFLELHPDVGRRCSVSVVEPGKETGTLAHTDHVLLGLSDGELLALAADARGQLPPPGTRRPALEVHCHGPVDFATDVQAVVAHVKYRGTQHEAKLTALTEHFGVELRWHGEMDGDHG
jgi:hypothetical protein